MNVALVSHQHLKPTTPTVGQYGHKVAHGAFSMKEALKFKNEIEIPGIQVWFQGTEMQLHFRE